MRRASCRMAASRTAASSASRSGKWRYAALGTTPTMRVTSRSTTASGPPERASSTPASTSAERTVPRGRGPRRAALSSSGDICPERLVDSVHRCAIVDSVHKEMNVFSRLATFLDANARRVLAVTVLAVAVAGAFGFGVANHMSPYGADDPATESVQATHRFEHAAGRQIDAGVVALVQPGDVRSSAAKARVGQVAAQLRAQPDVARVVSYYDARDPAMVSRDGRSTYVLAYYKPVSDKAQEDVAKQIEKRFSGQRDVKLGGEAIANAQVDSQVGNDLARAELLAFPFIFLLSLVFFRSLVAALLPPLLGGLTIVATFFALRRTLQTSGRTIIFSSLTIAAAIASLAIFPQRFLYSMGIGGALVALLAASLAVVVLDRKSTR